MHQYIASADHLVSRYLKHNNYHIQITNKYHTIQNSNVSHYSYHIHAHAHVHIHVNNKHISLYIQQYRFQLSHSIYYIVTDLYLPFLPDRARKALATKKTMCAEAHSIYSIAGSSSQLDFQQDIYILLSHIGSQQV